MGHTGFGVTKTTACLEELILGWGSRSHSQLWCKLGLITLGGLVCLILFKKKNLIDQENILELIGWI